MSVDIEMPRAIDLAHVDAVRSSAEHGVVNLTEPHASLAVGDKLEWLIDGRV